MVGALGKRQQLRHQHILVVITDALFGADTLAVAWMIQTEHAQHTIRIALQLAAFQQVFVVTQKGEIIFKQPL